ncbi:MAG: hypothetical protein IKR28_10830 [Selenomonadaceae bacterium]|nr:hypothetical protein [Selenomonadaceae bacterium]
MLDEKLRYDEEDEDEVYIPDLGEPDELPASWTRRPRSNAGIELKWSDLEQQMFDLLLINRFNTDAHDTLEDQVDTINMLMESFDENEIMRICSVALLAKQLKAIEGKNFADECQKYMLHVIRNPEDSEDPFHYGNR